MKKVIYGGTKAEKKIQNLPKLYIVGMWAKYGVIWRYFSGKTAKDGRPLVWDYRDCNGTCDKWILVPVDMVTTGWVYAWTTSEAMAEFLANGMNLCDRADCGHYKGLYGHIMYDKINMVPQLSISVMRQYEEIAREPVDLNNIEKSFHDAVDRVLEDIGLTPNQK